METTALLRVENLKKYYPIKKGFWKKVVGHIKAVDGVTFTIWRGETLGLVGESGCGKSTLGKCILRAVEPTEGRVEFILNGSPLEMTALDKKSLRAARRHMQMIFQDPYSSLDPRMTVMDIISEPLRVNKVCNKEEIEERVKKLVELVGLNVNHLKRYPHAFSGGQRQRIGIARALALNPEFIVADEPVSALDVSVQSQILNLLLDLQKEFHLTYLFISHDLGVIQHVSDRVAVMYVGRIVEMAPTEEIFFAPKHPYTEALIAAVPRPDPRFRKNKGVLQGEVPNPAAPPPGCYFHLRCPYATKRCAEETPIWDEITPGHFVACHYAHDLTLRPID
ncbi:MAG: dipeptide ABC transporter ATP-binding protein [Firmicutes bacterium]|nr:dipeptide ABC transporter ATP-binding protein [Bacillota bacterium]